MLPVIAALVGFTVAGVILRQLGVLRSDAAHRLNRVALSVTLPAGIFRSLHTFGIAPSALRLPLITIVVSLLLCGLASALSRALSLSRDARAVFILAVVFANTAFMGFPFVSAVYGDEGLVQAVLVDQLGMEPLAFTLGAALAASAAPGTRISWWSELAALARFPPLIALVAGIAWHLVGLPAVPGPVSEALRWISMATVPLVMISLGLVLRVRALRTAWRQAALVVLLRLVVAPVLGWAFSELLFLHPLQTAVTTVELGMPAMMFGLMLALRYGLDAELSAAFITATLVFSFVTLPAWVALLPVAAR
jgi:predicted permease